MPKRPVSIVLSAFAAADQAGRPPDMLVQHHRGGAVHSSIRATILATVALAIAVAPHASARQAPAAAPAGVPGVKLPASPRGSSAIEVGGTWQDVKGQQRYVNGGWIVIDYGRPLLRGRQNIFGTGADYGKVVSDGVPVWRAGANDTTRLTTQKTLVFGKTVLQPGVYNVFVELKENAWTLVLSTQPVQPKYDPNDKVLLYGSYNYDPKFDVLRVPMRLSSSPNQIEQFTINFVDVTNTRASLVMAWERTVATIDFLIK
jgi:hypothetical protein